MKYPEARIIGDEDNEIVEIDKRRLINIAGSAKFTVVDTDGKEEGLYVDVESSRETNRELNDHGIFLTDEFDWILVGETCGRVTLVPLKKETE